MINSFQLVTKALPYVTLCHRRTVIVQISIVSVVLLPNVSICYSSLKNVMIFDGECVVMKVADPRSIFYLGKTSGCPSK